MQALIDGDLVAYRCAASAENEALEVALWRVDDLIDRILSDVSADTYRLFIKGTKNFRHFIYPEYKSNRTQPPPKWLKDVTEHLLFKWNAEPQHGIETDDALGIHQRDDTVICSLDKDLRQVPGTHYNWMKRIISEVNEYDGWFNFYRQFLMGDTSDNIIGVRGIGEKKAEKALYGLAPEEMFEVVRDLYNDDRRFLINGQCLYIWRKEFDLWEPTPLSNICPENFAIVRGIVSKSGTNTEEVNGPSSEPTTTSNETNGFSADGEKTVSMPQETEAA